MSEPGSLIRTLSGRQVARNFHSYVINEVGRAIVSGNMPVGSSLPGDAEMMDRFGVSRTVLREALKTLEAKGLVEARAKVGTRVLPQSRWNLFDRQILSWKLESGPSPAFLVAFRAVRQSLEVQAARLAAVHREAEHVRLLHYWLNQRTVMAHQPEPFAMAEFEIHRVVTEASGNPFLRASSAILEFGVAVNVVARLTADRDPPAEGLAAHHAARYDALVRAIERGDGEAAGSVMADLTG
ncbi:MAG: FadR/GntR family transcriptional regulator [Tabrizicola sp.]|uniref:FadR/GntR family transcriptional regulator n=1 Tax=Tabrizicola sp. TaxID=2005166 RepID=UPI002735817E|nr:FadR/GntR family transcriptional regulator [Tabrizicola sp.]MDP3264299.1 FadR/GntR family transcriptional regulator [Tabrizicola sp.]MDP3648656.1 FadR/GntR family transcriptional regulator [Paracoccaceae bacterium]MDZ4065810.1 FadR/GntR family transcriptional regulator [Tabrizicola sp.]